MVDIRKDVKNLKRFISLILAIIILFSIIPMPSFAKGQVMEIDALFGDLKLQLENRDFSHKEIFIYDGELWVPMGDLAKALGIGYDFNSSKRTLKLNSHGKLNIKATSIEPIAYQRGYEIQAIIRRIGEIENEIREFEGRKTNTAPSFEGMVRNIKVGFSDISIYLDNKKVDLDREPLLYNNDVYISLVSLSPILYITPEIKGNVVNIDGNAILVHKPGYYNIEYLASFRESLNNRLSRELAELEKKKKILMDVKIPYEEINNLRDMEWYLNRHLGYIDDLPVDINLSSGTNNSYYLDISFLRKYDYRWHRLTRRDVEAYIWDIYVAITSLYDEDAKIQGSIRNPNYSYGSISEKRNYVTFDTVYRNIQFNFYNSHLKDITEKIDPIYIEELLNNNLSSFNRIRFDYKVRVSGYDLELTIEPHSRRIRDWSPSMLYSYFYEINRLIIREYPDLKVYGNIVVSDDYIIDFSLIDGLISSNALNLSIEKDLNSQYGWFKYGSIGAEIKYTLVKISEEQYKLVANLDYDTTNNTWTNESLGELNNYIGSATSYVLSLIDGDLFVQIYDKKQVLLNEYSIFRNTVAMVVADPPSGDIVEGTKISLSTDTEGATIYYTIDGSTPNKNSLIYREPIEVYGSMIIKAFAVKPGLKESGITTYIYNTIPNPNMASRLKDLSVDNATLDPLFDKNSFNHNFKLTVPFSMDSITIRAEADGGVVLVNNNEIVDGKSTVNINVGTNMVKIIHRENGKTDRVYTIVVTRLEQDFPDLKIDIYEFNADILGVFKGQLSGGEDQDYRDYKIVLMLRDKANTVIKEIAVNPNGSFEDTFKVDIIHKIIKYKYAVYKGNNIVIEPTEIEFTN